MLERTVMLVEGARLTYLVVTVQFAGAGSRSGVERATQRHAFSVAHPPDQPLMLSFEVIILLWDDHLIN